MAPPSPTSSSVWKPRQSSLAQASFIALELEQVDAAAATLIPSLSEKLYEVSDFMVGSVIGFGYTNNVINKDVWDGIPEDLQQIIIEEGAKAGVGSPAPGSLREPVRPAGQPDAGRTTGALFPRDTGSHSKRGGAGACLPRLVEASRVPQQE